MGRRIPDWTERHSLVALAGVVALLGAGVSLTEGGVQGPIIIGALALTFAVGLGWDSWVGFGIGLAMAALVTFVRQSTGTWLPTHFGAAALESAALIATGWTAGRAGSRLRSVGTGTDEATEAGGAFGSLGMIPADLALVRLQEEVVRATSYRRPMALLLLEVSVIAPELDANARDDVFRAAARVTETMLRDMDVPFLFAPQRIGAILPETDVTAASVATGRILEALSTARFIDRRAKGRRSLAEAISVELAVVSLGPMFPTAGELLDGAIAALDRG